MSRSNSKRKATRPTKSTSNVPAFLLKTYEFLETPEYNNLISWNKEGNAFIVKNVSGFSEEILPKYFKHSNFASFVRQLNMYDFHKIRHEGSEDEFRHRYFKRGQKSLLSQIKRKIHDVPTKSPPQYTPSKNAEISKVKKETQFLSNELGAVKGKQNDLEKNVKAVYEQNVKLSNENKLLWTELNKSKEKYEKKMEKIMYFVCSMVQNAENSSLDKYASRMGLPCSENMIACEDADKLFEHEKDDISTPSHFDDSLNLSAKNSEKAHKEKPLNVATSYTKTNGINQNAKGKNAGTEQNSKSRRTMNKRGFPFKNNKDDAIAKSLDNPSKQVKTEINGNNTGHKRQASNNLEQETELPGSTNMSRNISLNEPDAMLLGATSANVNKFPPTQMNDYFNGLRPFSGISKDDSLPGINQEFYKNNEGQDDAIIDEPLYGFNNDNGLNLSFDDDLDLTLRHSSSQRFV